MDAASKLGWFVSGLIVGGVLGVVGMWLAYDAGRLIHGLKDDAQAREEIEEAAPKREQPDYIKRLNEAKERKQP